MAYKVDTEISILEDEKQICLYIISSVHRKKKGNSNKCIWTIDFSEEVECFKHTFKTTSVKEKYMWGYKLDSNSTLQEIGHNFDNERLKFAKFVDSDQKNIWHGWPADYYRRSYDRPDSTILKKWVELGIITKANMLKIRKGQLCSL